ASDAGRVSPQQHTKPAGRAGTPATRVCGATSLVTTAPAATIAQAPISCPHTTVALAPIVAPWRIGVGENLAGGRLYRPERGRRSLVNTQCGPRKASSSTVTPS